jgi:hypothetical protein
MRCCIAGKLTRLTILRAVLVTAVFLACVYFVDSSQAQIVEGTWCAIRNFGSDISEDCQFRTFEECRVTVIAGIRGFCNKNPRWQSGPANPRARRNG